MNLQAKEYNNKVHGSLLIFELIKSTSGNETDQKSPRGFLGILTQQKKAAAKNFARIDILSSELVAFIAT